MDENIGSEAIFSKALFDPGEGQCQCSAFADQPARELSDKWAADGRIGTRHVSGDDDKTLRIYIRNSRDALGPGAGQVFIDAVDGELRCQAAQIFN